MIGSKTGILIIHHGVIMDYTHHYDSQLGGITLASDGDSLVGLWFDGQKYYADSLNEEYEEKDLPVFNQLLREAFHLEVHPW